MILNWINPLTDSLDVIHLDRPYVDYRYWLSKGNKDVINSLNDILKNLDCTREYESGRPMMTTFAMYKSNIDDYYYYLLKLKDYNLYNMYIDLLINRHRANIIFEYYNPYIPKSVSKKKRNSKKRIIPDKFIKQKTTDIFTGEEVYHYDNLKTGEHYESSNPNFLDELKSRKKKKEKRIKRTGVPMEMMTFSFKKKNI